MLGLTDLDFYPFLGLNWIIVAEFLSSQSVRSPEAKNQILQEDQWGGVKVISQEGKDTLEISGRLEDQKRSGILDPNSYMFSAGNFLPP